MKILYVATLRCHIAQFHISFIKELVAKGHIVDVACRDNSKERPGLDISPVNKMFNLPFGRNPLKASNIKAYRQLKKIVNEGNYDIISCHTPVGGVLGRLAARKARKNGTKVIYMAHGFHFYKGAPIKNWILYYPPEKFCSRFTDTLITINKEDYEFAKKHMKAKKIEYVPGVGIDIEKFKNCKVDIAKKREELGIPKDAFLILSVGELNKNKNHKIILDALAEINNPNMYYAIAGNGPLHDYLLDYAKKLGIPDNFKLLGYRTDTPELYKIANLCIHPSFREGLPLTVLEEVASETPTIASNIRGNRDLLPIELLFNNNDHKEVPQLLLKFYRNKIMNQSCLNVKDYSSKNCHLILEKIYKG